jgi:hypothetical protein
VLTGVQTCALQFSMPDVPGSFVAGADEWERWNPSTEWLITRR